MALELQVMVVLVDSEPEVAGNPGILVRAVRQSTLITDTTGPVADAFVLAGAKIDVIADEVLTDFKGQLEIGEQNARANGV